MTLEFHHDYWDDASRRAAFKDFILQIHRLDFTRWETAGYWDPAFRPFSFFDEAGRVVASTCAYELDLRVAGNPTKAVQLSSVGTDPAYRRRGLNRRLTELALEASGRELVFLFANPDAAVFYRRCGFQFIAEATPSVPVDGAERQPGLCQLDVGEPATAQMLAAYAADAEPSSAVLGVSSVELFMFHGLYTLSDCLFHLPPLDVVVAFRSRGPKLIIYDVVGPRIPPLAALLPYLRTPETREVELQFVPDRLGVTNVRWRPCSDNQLHVRNFPLAAGTFLFPFTAHA